jgi:hypothetical protein
MLKQLKLFYYFYETEIIRYSNDTYNKDTYNNITGID